jgi:Phage Tail Collar Domain
LHHSGGIGVLGKSQGGKAGSFEGDVEVTGQISAKDFLPGDAQPGAPGLAKQVADLSSALKALTERMQSFDLQLLPIGAVVAFAGDVHSLANWMLCNGDPVSKDAFPELFGAIGTNWGGDGNPNFYLPDLRGLFLRGVDGRSEFDKDSASRTAIKPGGNSGAAVGSLQSDDFKEHKRAQARKLRNYRK